MLLYSSMLALGLALSAPWWLWRMARGGRYRAGLRQRLGGVPAALRQAAAARRLVWLHAVSVGEVLAAERLVHELGAAFGAEWLIVISTTTETGQKIARERFGAERVFYLPLDFASTMRRYLRALRPELVVTMESELWPRLIVECERQRIPMAVINARVSDRSFPRYMRLRRPWRPLLNKVSLFLAQGEETAGRLRAMGVDAAHLRVAGNLKFDLPDLKENALARQIAGFAQDHRIIVAGSTLPGEEKLLLEAWPHIVAQIPGSLLILAPRHPERFAEVGRMLGEHQFSATAASLLADEQLGGTKVLEDGFVLELDTLGDLSSVYGIAHTAFLGGSLVPKGGHNPLEAARFGVPVIMGPSYENFREIVNGMRAAQAIRIVTAEQLAEAVVESLTEDAGMGERGRQFFNAQAGATARTVAELLKLIGREHA